MDQAVEFYLSREEADEIFDKTTYHHDRPFLWRYFRNYVYAVTSKHAGALASLIGKVTKRRDIIRHYILKGLAITSTCEQYLFCDILGNRFYDLLQESPFSRGLPPRSCFTDDRYASALNQLLCAPFGYVHEAVLSTDVLSEAYGVMSFHHYFINDPLQLTLEILRRFVPLSLSDASLPSIWSS
ncbi:hypothetical protein BDD12DRAFT_229006 [Trichophaea hybrida]|nr:hypothetical protein BDD12DRAFT_229006 [Trichophaea hybrida]